MCWFGVCGVWWFYFYNVLARVRGIRFDASVCLNRFLTGSRDVRACFVHVAMIGGSFLCFAFFAHFPSRFLVFEVWLG